jgi:hypothetical protein
MARTRKLTVNVPVNVGDLLDRYADRVDSDRVCSEALERECRAVRDAARSTDAMAAAVARLRAQRAHIQTRAKEDGFRAGRQFVLDRTDYDTAAELEALYKRTLRQQPDDLAAEVRAALGDTAGEVLPRLKADQAAEWYPGFLEGAMDVWLRIRAEVEA